MGKDDAKLVERNAECGPRFVTVNRSEISPTPQVSSIAFLFASVCGIYVIGLSDFVDCSMISGACPSTAYTTSAVLSVLALFAVLGVCR